MNRNQIIVIAACVAACIGIFLFANTTKPTAETTAAATEQHSEGDGHNHGAEQGEPLALNIQGYISDLNSRIEDKATREKIEELEKNSDYNGLIEEYRKLVKPLAISHYAMKLADKEPNVKNYLQAGDYSATLLQTAPDELAANYLKNNLLEAYKKAAEIEPNNNEVKLRLATAYIEMSPQPMEGVAILREIVAKDSTNIDAQLLLGRFGIVSGQFDKAIVRLEKVLYLQPQNSEALLLLAEAYNNQGDSKKALELLERCKKTVKSPELRKEIEGYIEQIKKQVHS